MDLSSFGISPEGESVYRFFLRQPNQGLPFVTSELGLDRDTVEAAVEQLVQLGLLDVNDGHKVMPADPAVGIERLIEQRLNVLNEEIRRTLAARSTIGSFQEDQQQGEQATVLNIERVEGVERVRARIDDLAFFSYQETLCLQPAGPLVGGAIEAARPLDFRSLRRGIALRSVYQADTLKDEAMSAYLRDIVGLGAEVRITEDCTLDRLLIYDRNVAVVPLDPKESAKGALLVREPGLVSQMVAHFYKVWESAADMAGYTGLVTGEPTLSALEEQVLQSLATADKDETAARQMGVSVRTFRRYVADLMTRLGASNRFHAALLAKENKWI
jgi:DNA-binding CsgD family transcriptional regulator